MTNDNQIAVKKRLIYAEDLFEPVDFTVVQIGGRSGSKTMAMYEQLFRKRVELAPTIDAELVVHGRWIRKGNKNECDQCGFFYYSTRADYRRCPKCEAKMDLKEVSHG